MKQKDYIKKLSNGNILIGLERGKEEFYIIDSYKHYDTTYYLLESCVYGDDVLGIIIDNNYNILDYNWGDTLEEYIKENLSYKEIYKIIK